MKTKKINLIINKGSKYTHRFTWVDSSNNPIDISSYLGRMQIRQTLSSATVEIELTTANGGITLGGAAGTVDLYIGATDTDALDITTGVYDLELYNSGDSDDVIKLVEGQVNVVQNVTR